MLRISEQPSGEPEIFYSLQGEGVTMGTPSVFLRLALCNLSCSWCDTKYTWDWQNYDYHKEVVTMSLSEVEDRISRFKCGHLVITGGEPLVQQNQLALLVRSLKKQGFYCEIETNGTITPCLELVEDIDQWNVSPKRANSNNVLHKRESPRTLQCFSCLPNAYFKFVVVEKLDIEDICELAEKYELPLDRVILMPEGNTPEVVQERSQWIAQACQERGFRFSTRLHILLWGGVRGA